jgi:drug/metabolite transporter superfamily protein YnfA
MNTLRPWIIMSWIMLPGVMVGGSLLLRRLTLGEPNPFQVTWIRAFHAHGGVLILMSLVYYMFLERTALPASTKQRSALALLVGIGALVGGFLLHAILGRPNEASVGTLSTLLGAVLVAFALIVLVYGLIKTPPLIVDDRLQVVPTGSTGSSERERVRVPDDQRARQR